MKEIFPRIKNHNNDACIHTGLPRRRVVVTYRTRARYNDLSRCRPGLASCETGRRQALRLSSDARANTPADVATSAEVVGPEGRGRPTI
ncbi:hypothetical protein EVAR_3328_1 [Eumeta japonica]|uniref:Uncharacterized protein n=1 Tax=Eumeta variegata TaxID=151549 RepID=A0A4C1SW16_EUMVA|nr:hypothetical protein EVAR_3328_1 [Eumeta japonica]